MGEMHKKLTSKTMTIQNFDGTIFISAMKFKRLITMHYFFYTEEEAVEEFTIYLKNLKK